MKQHLALAPFCVLLFILPFPGTVALRLLCLGVAFVLAVFTWERLAPPSLPLKSVLLFWAILAVASLVYAVDPAYSFGEIKNELGYAMMAFVAFFAISSDEKRVKWMLLALAAGALLLCSAALVARFRLGVWDHAGWHGGIAAYATYLAAAVPAVLLLGFFYDDLRLRYAALLLLFIMLAAGFYSGQRIVWPVLFLQACVAVLFFRTHLRLNAVRLMVVFGVLALLVVAMLAVVQGARFKESPSTPPMSNDDRMVFWPKVAERIIEHPLTGAGFGRGVMKKAYPDLTPANNRELWHAHNVVLNYGLSMGLPGMLVILLVFGALGRQYLQFWRASDQRLKLLGACGIALVLGVFARNMVNDFFLRDSALLFWALNGSFLGLGLRLMAAESARKEFEHA